MVSNFSALLSLLAIGSIVANSHGHGFDISDNHRVANFRGTSLDDNYNTLLVAKDAVRFCLIQRNRHWLEDRLWQISDPKNQDYGRHMTVDELSETIGASQEHIDGVITWMEESLSSWSLALSSTEKNSSFVTTASVQWRLSITRDDIILTQAPVDLLVELFGIRLNESISFATTDDTNMSQTRTIRSMPCRPPIPEALQGIVEVIYFVCQLPVLPGQQSSNLTRKERKDVRTKTFIPVDPPLLYRLYDIHRSSDGAASTGFSAQSVAEFEQAYFFPEDLSDFESRYHLPKHPVDRIVGPNDPKEGYLAEASTDTQYATAAAPALPLWVLSNIVFDLSHWAETILNATRANGTQAPRVHSISWGSPEETFDASLLRRWNTEFLKLALTGHTVLAASGDRGTDNSGWFRCRHFRVQFPASSPFVTAVGGTTFVFSENGNADDQGDDRPLTEAAWQYSGGGFSDFFTRPLYQDGAVSHYLTAAEGLPDTRYYNATGRAVPDVAAAATNYQVLMQGVWGNVSGTSASAPVWAGLIAELNRQRFQRNLSPMGFLNPWLYHNFGGDNSGSVGRDVVTGRNVGRGCVTQGFPAVPGFDAVTGLGVPNHTLLLEKSNGRCRLPLPIVLHEGSSSEAATNQNIF